jgi:TonB family protein
VKDKKIQNGKTNMEMKARRSVAKVLLTMGLGLGVPGLRAQETRKLLNSPTPSYPETARQFRLTGVVKVQVVVAPDGPIKDVKVIGGHPVLVNAVEDTLKNWKYAPQAARRRRPSCLIFTRKRVGV